MHEPDRDSTPDDMRDWANKLPSDLAVEIAGRLLATDDLAEYIRFRAVCKPWRLSTPDPASRGLDARFFPRNWVMLPSHHHDDDDDTHTRRRRLMLNLATGGSIAVDDDLDHALSGQQRHRPLGYALGLLVLYNTATSGIRLLNPLTRAVTDLPAPAAGFSSSSAPASASASALRDAMDGAFFPYRCFVGVIYDGAAIIASPAPTVVLLFLSEKHTHHPLLAFIRPGEPRWSLADTTELTTTLTTCTARQHQVVSSVLSLRGRFYVCTSAGDVLALDLHSHPVPRLVRVVARNTATTATVPPAAVCSDCSAYLAPSGNGAGMLMVVVHYGSGEDEFRERIERVEVLEVDVDGGRLVPRADDRALLLFTGSVRALCVSTTVFPSIAGRGSAGAVYLCHGQGCRGDLFRRVVHVGGNGRADDEPAVEVELSEQAQMLTGRFFGPFNLDVYLACCVDALSFC